MNQLFSSFVIRSFVIAGLCFALHGTATLAVCAAELADLSEEERKHDPGVKAQTHKKGYYTLQISAVPTKLFAQTAQLNGALDELKKASRTFGKSPWVNAGDIPGEDIKAFTYAVLAPAGYDPAKPTGLLVGISAGGNGNFLHKYKQVLNDKNIITIGSNQSGNNINPLVRQTFAIYAVELIKRRYNIDPNRVYITGGSGGGMAASLTMYYRPDLFKGGMPMIGCFAPVKGLKIVRIDGKQQPLMGIDPLPSRAALKLSMSTCRYAFLTGERDDHRKSSELTAKYMQGSGYKHATVFVQPNIGHDPNSAEYFRMGLDFLDQPLIDQAAELCKEAERDAERGRNASALEKLESALPYLTLATTDEVKAIETNARQRIAAFNKQYNDMVVALNQAIEGRDEKAANEVLRELQRNWRDRLGREAANDYRKQILMIRRGG